MMDYEVFKNVITARIKEFLPPIYAKFDVNIEKIPKVNGVREAMILAFSVEGGHMAAPNIYLDELYERFSECGDIDLILQATADRIINFTGTQREDRGDMVEMEKYKNDIVQMLINTEMNQELLKKAPHREFFDLSVIYRLAVHDKENGGYATALITYELMESLGLTADELDALAAENSRRKLKTELLPLTPDLIMMTTEDKMYGAINLLRIDEIRKVSDKLNSNMYVLPSSVHDLMVITEKGNEDIRRLFCMLQDGNDNCNDVDENLSYNIYYYDREKDSLEIKYRDR